MQLRIRNVPAKTHTNLEIGSASRPSLAMLPKNVGKLKSSLDVLIPEESHLQKSGRKTRWDWKSQWNLTPNLCNVTSYNSKKGIRRSFDLSNMKN